MVSSKPRNGDLFFISLFSFSLLLCVSVSLTNVEQSFYDNDMSFDFYFH